MNEKLDKRAWAEKDFQERSDQYQMEVLLDHGVHRHLRFRIGNSMAFGFDLVTWPGHLAISGDMGSFTFSRLHDMTQFFHGDINPSYWAEKLVASDRRGGYEAFCEDKFKQSAEEWAQEYIDSRKDDDPSLESDPPFDEADFRKELQEQVLDYADSGEDEAYRAADRFEYEGNSVFQDFYEVRCREYTHHYLWCLHAIVHGVDRYRELKQSEKPDNLDRPEVSSESSSSPKA